MWKRILAAGAPALALAAAAAAAAGAEERASGMILTPPPLPRIATGRVLRGEPAPDFWAWDLEGGPVRFHEARAGRIAVLEISSYT